MTALTRNPTNLDLLQSSQFKLNFARLPGVTFFCQSVNIPGVSLSEVPYHTPFVDLYVPGEKIIYDTLNITFLVNEDLSSWKQLHDWVRACTFPVEFDEYRTMDQLSALSWNKKILNLPPQYCDGVLTIFTNKHNVNFSIHFVDLFPTSLSSIIMNSGDTADNVLQADATFRFSYYNIEKI